LIHLTATFLGISFPLTKATTESNFVPQRQKLLRNRAKAGRFSCSPFLTMVWTVVF
jgi:hypothetical protein